MNDVAKDKLQYKVVLKKLDMSLQIVKKINMPFFSRNQLFRGFFLRSANEFYILRLDTLLQIDSKYSNKTLYFSETNCSVFF